MPDTTVCAYCASVIPADAKTCPMCGADVAPDYLEPPVRTEPAEPRLVPAPPAAPPPLTEPLDQPFPTPRVIPPPAGPVAAATRRGWIILAGVMAAVVVCLCMLAIVLTLVARN